MHVVWALSLSYINVVILLLSAQRNSANVIVKLHVLYIHEYLYARYIINYINKYYCISRK